MRTKKHEIEQLLKSADDGGKPNNLTKTHPELAKEFHPTKNGGLKVTDFTKWSPRDVWWQCSKGHEFQKSVVQRTKNHKCPVCQKSQRPNLLMKTHPEIAKEFHPTKNDELLVTELTKSSPKKVWWQCSEGHDYEMTVVYRTQGYGCPICRERMNPKKMMLAHSEFAKEFHPTKNGGLKVTALTKWSPRNVWWQCSEGHEFQMSVSCRTQGYGCPICREKVNPKKLPLAYPEIAKEFHPTKNGELLVTKLTKSSNQKVWWQCSKGHEWQTTVYRRTQGYGCPVCRKKVKPNNLTVTHPEIAKEFHPMKNGELLVTGLTRSDQKKVWWRCEHGHEYEKTTRYRTQGYGCPICRKKQKMIDKK